MGQRLVVTMVLEERPGRDVYAELGDVVAARGVVGFHIDRRIPAGEEQDTFGPVARQSAAAPELEAVGT